MQNNNFNNGAANNNSNNNGAMMIMMNGTIRTMEVFVGTVKSAMEAVYGSECRVDVHKVVKNNGLHLSGITIRNRESNMAPTIYLDGYYADYKDGRTMENICKEIVQVYEKNNFRVSGTNVFFEGKILRYETYVNRFQKRFRKVA